MAVADGLLFLCRVGQTAAALRLPGVAADIIGTGILTGDTAYVLHDWLRMLAAAASQCALAVAWLGARIAMDIGRNLHRAVLAQVQGFSLRGLRGFGVALAGHPFDQ